METVNTINILNASIFAMKNHIYKFVIENGALKFMLSVYVEFIKCDDSTIKTDPPVCLSTQPFEVYRGSDINDILSRAQKELLDRINSYEKMVRDGFYVKWCR